MADLTTQDTSIDAEDAFFGVNNLQAAAGVSVTDLSLRASFGDDGTGSPLLQGSVSEGFVKVDTAAELAVTDPTPEDGRITFAEAGDVDQVDPVSS